VPLFAMLRNNAFEPSIWLLPYCKSGLIRHGIHSQDHIIKMMREMKEPLTYSASGSNQCLKKINSAD
jgi:hypothetical protein